MQEQNSPQGKESEFIEIPNKRLIIAGIILVIIAFLIGLLLSMPSIQEYCESKICDCQDDPFCGLDRHPCHMVGIDYKTAWFGINIWKNADCSKYFEIIKEYEKVEQFPYFEA